MDIYYNSWDSRFKKPFGAIQAGASVQFAINVNESIQGAILWLTKTNESPVAYPMNFDQESGLFVTQVTIGTSGLYFYYFAIKQNNKMYYVERGQFGQGKVTQNVQSINSYQLTVYDRKAPRENWYRNGIVYQIFPDRFANGNPHGEITGRKKNTFIYATHDDTPYYIKNTRGEITRWDFYGGNLKGIQQKIPYLKNLGVTTIYLNPIFLASSNHRYDTEDFMKIDPMLGTETDLKNLINELHRNKMHLILDGVFNHVGKDSIYFQGALQGKSNPYYSWFNFINYPNRYQSWWGVDDLPEVNKSNRSYQDFIYGEKGVLAKWTRMQVDGWRIDVADELPMPFLRNIRERLMKENCQVLIGEVWEDASNKFVNSEFRPYMSGDNLTGTMNYPIRNFIINLLQAQDSDSAIKLLNGLAILIENYPSDFMKNCLNNIGTHDTERIKTVLQNDEKMVALAFALMMVLPGVPCIYYGDEAGLIGKKDPDNRRFFPWKHISDFLENQVSKLAHFRLQHSVLVDGKIAFIHVNENVNGIVRTDDKETVLFLFNKGKQAAQFSENQIEIECLPKKEQERIKKVISEYSIGAEDYLLKVLQ